jgi:hypothetical protein
MEKIISEQGRQSRKNPAAQPAVLLSGGFFLSFILAKTFKKNL